MQTRYFVESRREGDPWTREGCNAQSMLGYHTHASYRAALVRVRALRKLDAVARYRIVVEDPAL